MTAPDTDYLTYLQDEWRLFTGDPRRQQQSLTGAGSLDIQRLLDVGCGGGQEMIPFCRLGAACIGLDVLPASARFGRDMFRTYYPGAPVQFATAMAEQLPFADDTFDVVLCRVAIPYTDNRRALAEIGRVLRPGGALLLKTHHARYYVQKFLDGIRMGSPLYSLHALRVLVSGLIFQVSGRQPAGRRVLLRETYLTTAMLHHELRLAGLKVEAALPDSNRLTPSYRIRRDSRPATP
jgi:SAM-dependent methyltransferase